MDETSTMRTGSILLCLGLGIVLAGCAASQPLAEGDAAATTAVAAVAPAVGPAPPPHAVDAPEPMSVLPEGPGRETTIRVCSGCHAVELVAEQRLTHAEWFTMVQFMGDRGAMGTPAEFAEITDYLAEAFPKE